jgi:hypothetical protein
MADGADSNYSVNPWMAQAPRPGDGVDPTVILNPEETILAVMAQAPVPLPAGYTPRLLGYERDEPGIVDVLGVNSVPLMQDTETRQDSGMQGTLRPASNAW